MHLALVESCQNLCFSVLSIKLDLSLFYILCPFQQGFKMRDLSRLRSKI